MVILFLGFYNKLNSYRFIFPEVRQLWVWNSEHKRTQYEKVPPPPFNLSSKVSQHYPFYNLSTFISQTAGIFVKSLLTDKLLIVCVLLELCTRHDQGHNCKNTQLVKTFRVRNNVVVIIIVSNFFISLHSLIELLNEWMSPWVNEWMMKKNCFFFSLDADVRTANDADDMAGRRSQLGGWWRRKHCYGL